MKSSNNTKKINGPFTFYVGSYTNKKSKGIYKFVLDSDGSLISKGLVSTTSNPSFLSITNDKRYLIAVNETPKGSIESYRIKEDSLELISQNSSGGDDPCFVAVNKSSHVLVANYSSGNIGLLTIDENGKLSNILDLQQHSGNGISERQKKAHAHSAWFVPSSNDIISLDLGSNELWISELDINLQKLNLSSLQKIGMQAGAGPRHLAFHPVSNYIYVLNELNATITEVIRAEDGSYYTGKSYSTLPTEHSGRNLCAEIQITRDGRFLYVSNRGLNSIAIFEVYGDSSLNLIAYQSTLGQEPRSFSLSPDDEFLLVANQDSNNIVAFRRDQNTGLLKYISQIEAHTPVHILFE